jgi:iron complex outermembrane recepter protein
VPTLSRVIVWVWILCIGVSADAVAQQLQISGTVDDGTGVVPAATVTLRDPAGKTRESATDGSGRYMFDGLSAGVHQVTVSVDGYAPASRSVTLSDRSPTVDLTLRVAEIVTSVQVTAVGALGSSLEAPTLAGSRLNLATIDIPASATTLSGVDIRLRGDANVNAAVTRAVGITSTYSVGGGGNTVAARGFGGSSVAFMYDGIRNMAGLGNLGWPYDPWTVERIEVLNGPSSVLFGIGGIGGSINIVPRRPVASRQHAARLSTGSFGTYKAAVDTTGPLTDRVLYRVDVSRQQSDGYIDRGKSESTAVSGSVAFLSSDALKLTLMNDWAYIKPMNYNGLPMIDGVTRRELRRENYGTSDVDVYYNENSTRLELDWAPRSGFSLRNTASFLYGDRLWQQGPTQLNYQPATNDVIRSGFGKFEQDQSQFNDQIEASWRHHVGGRENTFVIGGDAEHLAFTRIVTQWPGRTSVVSLVNPVPGTYPATGATITQAQTSFVNRFSIFTEDRLELTPALSVVGGLRFDNQAVTRRDLVTPEQTETDRTYRPINWRAGAVYEIRPNTNLYWQFSKATDAISGVSGITAAQMAFDPSRGQQTEVGIKQSVRDGRLEWTVAGYRIVKKDLLIPDPIQIATLIQVGSQSSRGVEATLGVDVLDGLRIGVNGTVLDPQFDEFFENVGGVRTSRNGSRPTNVPWKSGNVLATWSFRRNWLAQGSLRYVGQRYIDTANTLVLPAYTVVDANVRRSITRKMAVDLRVANLFDEFYAYNFSGNGRGGGNWNVGAPRAVELSLTAEF